MLEHKTKRRFRLVPIACLIIVFLFSVLAYIQLRVNYVECYTQFGPCPDKISSILGGLKNRHLLGPLPTSQVAELFKKIPEIHTFNLYRRLPNTLIVNIVLRRPIGAIGSAVLGSQVAIVDEDGVVVGYSNNTSLPLLEISGTSTYKNTAIQALETISSLSSGRVSGKLEAETLQVNISQDTQIIIDITKPKNVWFSPLQFILTRSKMLGKIPKRIDLRYTNPVITY
jgi:cell division septal protein FtsQ